MPGRSISTRRFSSGASREATSEAPAGNPAHVRGRKKHCEECTHYRHCPRMRGENICHGLLPENTFA
ncbi:MAG: hypothetical protein N2689_12630 [Verrucomicrobiae bacterium]|nr:hypothetical protein [Verrucomicrobiae bacterium]